MDTNQPLHVPPLTHEKNGVQKSLSQGDPALCELGHWSSDLQEKMVNEEERQGKNKALQSYV